MLFACTQENLLQGLSLVGHIAGKNANLPVLGNVLLKAEGGNLKLCTTNLEMAVSALVRGRVDEPGEFTVPAKLLLDYVALLPDGKIELKAQGDTLEVISDGKATGIKGTPASEFPLIPKLAKQAGYKMKASAVREAIGQVAFAVSASESRPELSGVACFFHGPAGQDRLIMAATDSYRLSERQITLSEGGSATEVKCIVPARTLQEAARILSAYKDDVAVPEEVEWSIADSQLVMGFGNVELISRLIEGSFPDYKQIIPTQFRSNLEVKRNELAKAVRAASLFARQGLYDVHLTFTPEKGLAISSADTGTGAHTTTLPVTAQGDANHVTLNFKYLLDGLAAFAADSINVQMIDAMNPVVLTATGHGLQYVVMPIRQ